MIIDQNSDFERFSAQDDICLSPANVKWSSVSEDDLIGMENVCLKTLSGVSSKTCNSLLAEVIHSETENTIA